MALNTFRLSSLLSPSPLLHYTTTFHEPVPRERTQVPADALLQPPLLSDVEVQPCYRLAQTPSLLASVYTHLLQDIEKLTLLKRFFGCREGEQVSTSRACQAVCAAPR